MQLWPLFLTHTVTSSREIKAPYDRVLRTIQDPKILIESNPLVVGFTVDSASGWYSVTDKTFVLGRPYILTYRARFDTEEDGLSSYVEAGGGVTIKGRWNVEVIQEGEESKVKVTDEDTVTVPFILSPFVMSNLRSSHNELLDRLVTILATDE